jgi:hypothetical protein
MVARIAFVITIFTLLWASPSNAAEKYCVDLDSRSYGKFYIYQLPDKNNSGLCDKNNVSGAHKERKLIALNQKTFKKYSKYSAGSFVISEEDLTKYLKDNNLNADLKYIQEDQTKYIQKNNTSTLETKKESCYDKIDFTWSIPKNDMFGKFSFTSRSEKSINIHKIIIYTKDNQLVLEDEVSLNLKPFGIGSTEVFVGDRNKAVLNLANYRCSFGYKNQKVLKLEESNEKNDGWFRWWYIFVALGAFAILERIITHINKIPETNKNRSVVGKTSKHNELKKDGFILGFVRGDVDLAKAFWLYFVLANVVLNVLGLVIDSPLYDVNIKLLYIILNVIWNVLAVIGVFNSADVYKAEKIKINESYVWATVAKVATILLILSAIGNSIKYFK